MQGLTTPDKRKLQKHSGEMMEHLGEIFYLKVKDALERQHWKFARFEISETPLRVYAIAEETF